MAQVILDDGINVMGSGTPAPPDRGPIAIMSPIDGTQDVVPPVVISGTAEPSSPVLVKVSTENGAGDVATLTSDEDGAWTTTLDAWPSWVNDADLVSFVARYPESTDGADTVAVTAQVEPPEEAPAARAASVPEPDTIDPSNYTVAQVQAYLAEHPEDTEAVLAAERAGKNRVTLVNTEEN